MSATSNIEWTGATWNPVVGCTPVSPGCLNCYAAGEAYRWASPRRKGPKKGQPVRPEYVGLTVKRSDRAVFNGTVRCLEDRLTLPLRWRKPRRIFINSMSDLFHEAVPFEFVDRVFAVMALCPRHTFQILTKRPDRMAEYMARRTQLNCRRAEVQREMVDRLTNLDDDDERYCAALDALEYGPLPNVWLGTSVEDQQRADDRIPHLLRCWGNLWLSCEPLLEGVDLRLRDEDRTIWRYVSIKDPEARRRVGCRIGHVVVGGESGRNARPCDLAWIRSIVRQCQDAGVPVFVKQLGARPYAVDPEREHLWGHCPDDVFGLAIDGWTYEPSRLKSRKGADIDEWPEDLRVRQWPHGFEAAQC